MTHFSKKLITSIVFGIFSFSFLFPVESAIAADAGSIVGFEITAPTTAKVNEAIDVTVRAIDKDKNTVTNYRGSIIFVSANMGDTVPSPGKAIAFTTEDAGQKKFSKGITFRSPGKQKIYISDLSDDVITGEATITVDPATTTSTGSTETVTIITPENNGKVASDVVVVGGKARKNSKITFTLNNQDAGSVVTGEDGIFSKTLSGITQSKNILTASLLDANGAVIAKSPDTVFEKMATTGSYYNTIISPSNTLEASSKMTITVEADPGMQSVIVNLDNVALETKETSPGKYTIETSAPAKPGPYSLSVNLTNSLGQTITKPDTVSVTVNPAPEAPKPVFENVKVTTEGDKAMFVFAVKNAPTELEKFKIAYGESADSLREEAMTYSTGKIFSGGLYSWYIPKLKNGKYTFKVFGVKADGSLIDGLSSDAIDATVGQGTCSIGNVGDIHVQKGESSSILEWASVTGAVSYNIYKVSASGDYTFFQNTKNTKYTLFLSSGSIQYENFAVKALCDENTISADYSKAQKVQTGPGMLALLVIISGIGGVLFIRRKSF